MEGLRELSKGVTYRECPGCGAVESQLHIDRARYNFPCTHCGKHLLSEFTPVRPEPPRPRKRKAT